MKKETLSRVLWTPYSVTTLTYCYCFDNNDYTFFFVKHSIIILTVIGTSM